MMFSIIFWADDLQLYCLFKASEALKLSSLISCLSNVKQWLSDNCLLLNSEKTETLIVDPGSAMIGIKQHLGNLRSSVKSRMRNRGVCFYESMLKITPNSLSKTSFFSCATSLSFDLSSAQTRLDYCNSLFTCVNKKEVARLQYMQNSFEEMTFDSY